MRKIMEKGTLINGNPDYRLAQEIGLHFLTLHTGVNEGAMVDMEESSVKKEACGTTMCHGGWFQWITLTPNQNLQSYSRGADKMAIFLGFSSMYRLEEWAEENPKLWANEHGGDMFSEHTAFVPKTNHPRQYISLAKIGKHWLKVAARLEDVQTKEQA